MPPVFYILFGAAFTVAVSVALGRIVLNALRIQLAGFETWIFSFLLGAGVWSTALLALAAVDGIYKGTILGLGAVALYYGRRRPWPRLEPFSWWTLLAAPFFVLYLTNAMAPEISPDGSSYHLGLVSRYYREHGFSGRYESMYAHLSQAMEMLFLSAWAFGRNSAAALVHFAFLTTLPLLMIAYGRRFELPHASLAAAALFYFTPVVGIDGISAYNDVACAAVAFGVFYLLQIWDGERTDGLLVSIGLLAGFAYGLKYTAGLAIPYSLAVIVWKTKRLRPALIVVGSASLMVAPWMVKSLVVTGNPLSPFFNAWFPNPYVTPAFEESYRYFMRHYEGIASVAQLPAELLVRGKLLNGLLGPVWIAMPLALLAWKNSRGRWALGAAAVFGSVYLTNEGTRFLIPMLPFAALALCSVFQRFPLLLVGVVLAHGITAWPDVARRYSDRYAWRLDRIWWKQALRIRSEEDFLNQRLQSYPAARLMQEKVPPGQVVLTFNPEAEAYTSREIRVSYQSTANNMLGDLMHVPLNPDAQPRRRVEFRFAPVHATAFRLVQDVANPVDQWYVNDLSAYSGNYELERDADWHLSASSAPWFLPNAFDGEPLTWWQSGEGLRPGQFIQVDWPRVHVFDRVVVESGFIEQSGRLHLQILEDGQWRDAAAKPSTYEVPAPLGLRRQATIEVRKRGVGWIMIGDQDFGAADYFARQPEWGIELVGAASGRKLYRIRPAQQEARVE